MEIKKHKKNINIIEKVNIDSIGEEVEIEVGDILLSINNQKIDDIIDYKYMITSEILNIEIQKKNGEIWDIEIEKEYDEDIGIEFTNPLMDGAKSCTNNCIFCFVDQLPKGMRETLYFKDDDSRLSFLQGNFVTLTNMKEKDIDRIIEYRISPINVSVHTTNPDLRQKILKNKNSKEILNILKQFKSAGININCQIVAMPGINDGIELKRTLRELSELYPSVESIGIVPVGLTKYREGLFDLRTFTKEEALALLNLVDEFGSTQFKKIGTRLAFASDEFYILADREIPDESRYEGYPQLENGIGLIRSLKTNIENSLSKKERNLYVKGKYTIATGVLAYKTIKDISKKITEKFPNIKIEVVKITNEYFGKSITVTGLITGIDLLNNLKNKDLGEGLILSRAMFKSDEYVFLDDMKMIDLEKKLNTNIIVVDLNSDKLIDVFDK